MHFFASELMLFDGYGCLEWLPPDDYCTDKWNHFGVAIGANGVRYDIVFLGEFPCDFRYTKLLNWKNT